MKLRVSIDEVGRIVLPKPVRDSLGISGRSHIAVEVFGGKAEISAADDEGSEICRKNGRVVSCTPVPDGWNSGEAISRLREERLRR